MEHTCRKKLGNRILLSCSLFAVILAACIGGVGYHTYQANITERYQVYTGTLLEIASGYFDADDTAACIRSGEESAAYENTRKGLGSLKADSEISYIYAVYFPDPADNTAMNFIMNGTTAEELAGQRESDVISRLGEPCMDAFGQDMREAFWNALNREQEAGKRYYIVNRTEEYGYQMTGYTALRDKNGAGIGILAIDLSVNKIRKDLTSYLMIVVTASIALLALFLTIFLRNMNRNVITPVKEIALSAVDFVSHTDENVSPSELHYRAVEVHTGDEIEILAQSLHKMTDEIKTFMENLQKVTAEKERIGAELNVAAQIQANMLPCIFPAFPEIPQVDIFATMEPAKEVGGDFYDFFTIDHDHIAVVIADVSGKGVPAALFMVIAKTLIKNHAQAGESPAEIFTNVNHQLCENNEASLFVTAWLGILEISTGLFTYVNAGHNPPILKRGPNDFAYLNGTPGFVLAGIDSLIYRQSTLTLAPGDMLYLYTDGITEATDPTDSLYGETRLLTRLNETQTQPLPAILETIRADIDTFANGAPQFDDITMLILKINPPATIHPTPEEEAPT